VVTISLEQDRDGDELDEAFVVGRELVAAGGDAADLLQPAGEALDKVAFLVEDLVVRAWLCAVRPGRDDRFCSRVAMA